MYELKKQKNEFRKSIISQRQEISENVKVEYDKKIAGYFLSSISYRYSKYILIYISEPYEIDTSYIIEQSLKAGKIVACPVSDKESSSMAFKIIHSHDDLILGAYGIMEPSERCEDYNIHIQGSSEGTGGTPLSVCVTPCLSFDKEGFRIGYGKGFYDRFLSGYQGVKIGFCYHQFIVNSLPRGRYDIKLDVGISQDGILAFK